VVSLCERERVQTEALNHWAARSMVTREEWRGLVAGNTIRLKSHDQVPPGRGMAGLGSLSFRPGRRGGTRLGFARQTVPAARSGRTIPKKANYSALSGLPS